MAIGVGISGPRIGGGGGFAGSATIAVDNASPNIGDTINYTITESGFTATSYKFVIPIAVDTYEVIEQASNTYAHTVTAIISGSASGTAIGVGGSATTNDLSVYSIGKALDYITSKPDMACSLYALYQSYTSAIVNIRRSSDNATADFTEEELTDGTAVTWVGVGNTGYLTTLYDQTGNKRHIFQSTASYQGVIIESGAVVVNRNGKFAYRNQNGTQAMRTYGHLRGVGCVFAVTDINAITSGTQAWIFTSAGNPAIGTYSNNPADTSSSTTSSGSPSYRVNSSSVTAQRGALGTAVIGNDCIISINDADFLNPWRASDVTTILLYGDTSSKASALITFNKFDSAELTTLEDALNDIYGAY